jgi:hypothetical protein
MLTSLNEAKELSHEVVLVVKYERRSLKGIDVVSVEEHTAPVEYGKKGLR